MNNTFAGVSLYTPNVSALQDIFVSNVAWSSSILPWSSYQDANGGSLTELEYNLIRNAQQREFQLKAPAFSTLSACYNDATSAIRVGNDMAVHCYNIPNPDNVYDSDITGNISPW